MTLPSRPTSRHDFRIAILCALSKEAEIVERVFDKTYKREEAYGKAYADTNTYTTGAIGGHNVVLTYCPDMGGNAAAAAAAQLRLSFPGVEITLVVGICGAAPFYKDESGVQEIVLGDCIISTALVQGDFGRIGPGGFSRKDSLDVPGRAGASIRTLLAKLRAHQSSLEDELQVQLSTLQKDQSLCYPGTQQDHLYESDYIHTHSPSCEKCNVRLILCERDCREIGCSNSRLLPRQRLQQYNSPRVHFGAFGSSNAVIKSGIARDAHTKEDKIIAFEMEGSGVWDVSPTIIIKAACDYADSHKNKVWQRYAAAVAAAGLKACLVEVELSDPPEIRKFVADTTRDIKAQDAISQADIAIREYYLSSNRLHVERLSGEKLPLESCYINLSLVDQNGEKRYKDDRPAFSLTERLKLERGGTNNSISLKDLFESRTSPNVVMTPRRIYIQGRAGIGKTTLCKKIVHEFLNGLWSSLFDRLLWVPLRALKSKEGKYGWQDLLQQAYSPHVEDWDGITSAMAKQLLKKEFLNRSLLLFDGLDEVSHRWTREDEMFKFVECIMCDAPNLIITSRPQANSFDIGTFHLELETIGFSLDQVHTYLKKCVKDEETVSTMKGLIAEKPLVQGLLKIPIQLDAFCCTWPSKASSERTFRELSTMTSLYHSITSELCAKDVDRLEKAAQPRKLAKFKICSYLREELTFLEEYAFQGMINGLVTFAPHHRETIDSFLFNASNQVIDLDSFVLERLSFLRTSDIEQDPSKRDYHFLHLTFQKFFAARHYVRHWLSENDLVCLSLNSAAVQDTEMMSPIRFLRIQKYNPRFNIFWRFVTGLVQLQAKQVNTPMKGRVYDECSLITTFFDQLNDEPLDLFGNAHRWLLMYCLSEVMPSNKPQIRALRAREEDLLRQWVISEYDLDRTLKRRFTRSLELVEEFEYPDEVLCSFLRLESEIPHKKILSALEERPSVGMHTLRFISHFMNSQVSTDTQMQAIKIVFKNSRIESREIVEQAAQLFSTLLNGHDRDAQKTAIETMEQIWSWPPQNMAILFSALKKTCDPQPQRH